MTTPHSSASPPERLILREDRVVVIGTSGSGKSTLTRALSAGLTIPAIELDLLFWDRNWTPVATELFRERVERTTREARWICDGNYGQVRDAIWPRATAVIWLRYSFLRTLLQIVRRTVRRSLTGENICGENRESLLRSFLHHDSIILWMLKTWGRHRRNIPRLLEQPEHRHLRVFVCDHPRQTEELLQASLAYYSKSA